MEAESAEERWEITLLPGHVDEAARGECGSVESADTGERYDDCEDESADGSEDFCAICYGDGVGGPDYATRENEVVGHVGE